MQIPTSVYQGKFCFNRSYLVLTNYGQIKVSNFHEFYFLKEHSIDIRGCQIGMQGPQLCAKPHHVYKLDVGTSRMAFLDLNLHVLQPATIEGAL